MTISVGCGPLRAQGSGPGGCAPQYLQFGDNDSFRESKGSLIPMSLGEFLDRNACAVCGPLSHATELRALIALVTQGLL